MKYAFITVLLSAGIVLAALACGQDKGGQGVGSTTPAPVATAGTPQAAGHEPAVPQYRELPDDTTGGTRWAEISEASAALRIPADDKEWEVAVDPGDYEPFSGVPNTRVTHLATGRARVYSLSTVYNVVAGQVLLCSDRSAVLDQPGNQGVPLRCSEQSLTPEEEAVFGHVAVTGSHETHPPPPYPVPTQPGLEVPILLPTPAPQASPHFRSPTPTQESTPTPEVTP